MRILYWRSRLLDLLDKEELLLLSKYFRKKKAKRKKIDYLTKMVTFCIVFIVIYTIVQQERSFRLGQELTPTLTTCVYAFFGTELALTALIKILDKRETKKKETKKKKSTNEVVDIDTDNHPVG